MIALTYNGPNVVFLILFVDYIKHSIDNKTSKSMFDNSNLQRLKCEQKKLGFITVKFREEVCSTKKTPLKIHLTVR